MTAFIAAAVILFIILGLKRRMQSVDLGKDDFAKGMRYAASLAVGVALLILSPTLLILLNELTFEMQGVVAMLGLIAIAMLFIIPSGIAWGNFIKEHNIPTDEDEQKLSEPAKRVSEALCGVIMLSAVAVFLILGFVFSKWHPGWVVFPIGALLCGMVSTIVGAKDHKQDK